MRTWVSFSWAVVLALITVSLVQANGQNVVVRNRLLPPGQVEFRHGVVARQQLVVRGGYRLGLNQLNSYGHAPIVSPVNVRFVRQYAYAQPVRIQQINSCEYQPPVSYLVQPSVQQVLAAPQYQTMPEADTAPVCQQPAPVQQVQYIQQPVQVQYVQQPVQVQYVQQQQVQYVRSYAYAVPQRQLIFFSRQQVNRHHGSQFVRNRGVQVRVGGFRQRR